MSYQIPDEELTNEGPYALGPTRRLNALEVAYTEFFLQVELSRTTRETVPEAAPAQRPGQVSLGRQRETALRQPPLPPGPSDSASAFQPSMPHELRSS